MCGVYIFVTKGVLFIKGIIREEEGCYLLLLRRELKKIRVYNDENCNLLQTNYLPKSSLRFFLWNFSKAGTRKDGAPNFD